MVSIEMKFLFGLVYGEMGARGRVAVGLQRLDELQRDFLGAGGSLEEFRSLANGGMELGDDSWHPWNFKPGSLLEHHCYENRGRPQGVAVVQAVLQMSIVSGMARTK